MPRISKAELIRLQKKLGTDAAIGGKFGITRQAVHIMRKKYGIPSRLPDYAGRNAEIVAFHKKGMEKAALAKKFDLSVLHIAGIIRNAVRGKEQIRKKSFIKENFFREKKKISFRRIAASALFGRRSSNRDWARSEGRDRSPGRSNCERKVRYPTLR